MKIRNILIILMLITSIGAVNAISEKVVVREELVWSEYSGVWSVFGDKIYKNTFSDGSSEYQYKYITPPNTAEIYAVQPITNSVGQDVTVTMALKGVSCTLGVGGTHDHIIDLYFGTGSSGKFLGQVIQPVPCGLFQNFVFSIPNSYFGGGINVPGTYPLTMIESVNVGGQVYTMGQYGKTISVVAATSTPAPTPAPTQSSGGGLGTGYIKVTSNVAGAVYIDNVMSGMTGNTFTVSGGGHSVKVTQSGYNDYSTTVSVNNGATSTVSATLTATSSGGGSGGSTSGVGYIKVTSNVAGVVYIDGSYIGVTGNTFTVSGGGHDVKVTQSGYSDYITSVTADNGGTATVSATLTAISSGGGSSGGSSGGGTVCSAGYTYTNGRCAPSQTPPSSQPIKTPVEIIMSLLSWLKGLFGLSILGANDVSIGAGAQSFVLTTVATENPDNDYSDGSYSELWGTWMIVDSSQNIVAQKGSWLKLSSSTYSDTATYTFANKGSYAVVSVIIKVPYTYSGTQWTKGTEAIIGQDKLGVGVKTPAPGAATNPSPPASSLGSILSSLYTWFKSLFGL